MGHVFGHLLVPVDLSDHVTASLGPVAELARAHDSRITLLHVIEQIEDGPSDELAGFYAELEALAQGKLAAWAKQLSAQGLKVDVAILRGKRVTEILRFADEHDCQLTVLRTHRVDAAHPVGALGTISHQVALLSDRPVLLLR